MFGCHEEPPHIEPALVPQDCGLHMDTQQVNLQLADGKTLTLESTGEAFAFSASGVQNSMSNISMLRKLLIKSLFLANVDNIMAAPAVSFGFIISYAGKEVNRVEKDNRCYESFRYGGGYQ